MQLKNFLYGLLGLVLLGSCKEKFAPPVISSGTNYLVVEGLINSGAEPTSFQLSRTVKLADTVIQKPEPGARVIIEGNDNSQYPLLEGAGGNYTINQLILNNTAQYRLHIFTADNKEYASDFVPVKNSPEIDSVSWKKINADQVQISVNTHDPANNTRYYKWEYEEAWEYRSVFETYLRYSNGTFIRRDSAYAVNRCWHIVPAPAIYLGSSAKLTQDVIQDFRLQYIYNGSDKIRYLYSIDIKQSALTKEAYDFWQLLKKNTESLGSIFDAQPSELSGNIHCLSNPAETVIGFVSAGSVVSKRIFIEYRDLVPWVYPVLQTECVKWLVPRDQTDSMQYYFGNYGTIYTPIDSVFDIRGNFVGIGRTYSYCADCTELGGTNVKPPYWPY